MTVALLRAECHIFQRLSNNANSNETNENSSTVRESQLVKHRHHIDFAGHHRKQKGIQMTVLKGVTEKSPSSIQVLEDSGLPFGFILQPFAPSNADETDKIVSSNSTSSSLKSDTAIYSYPKSFLCVKCTHCGSHLNPSAPFLSSTNVLCNFCCQIYSTDWRSQYDAHTKKNEKKRGSSNSRIEMDSMLVYEKEYKSRWGSRSMTSNVQQNSIIEYRNDLHEQSLPLLTVQDFKTKQLEDIYVLPSSLCPPLLAIFIDGTSKDKYYYRHISSCLSSLIESNDDETFQKFKGTRMGIFIMTNGGGLSIFDLSKIGGHLKQCWTPETPLIRNLDYPHSRASTSTHSLQSQLGHDVAPLSHFMSPQEIFAPLDSGYSRACIENALREIADSTIIMDQACQRRSVDKNCDTDGVALGSTLQYFVEFMDEVGYHPGEPQLQELIHHDEESKNPSNKFCYAGGKILCFLSGPPLEIGSSISLDRCGRIGTGGFGGSCYEFGKRFDLGDDDKDTILTATSNATNVDIEVGGIKQTSLKTQTKLASQVDDSLPPTLYKDVDEFYSILGTNFASNAFGLEVFAVAKQEMSEQIEKYFGLPLLRLLSDRSGGCGPLIVSYHNNTIADTLGKEVVARSPWTRPIAYGGILRIRIPSSLKVLKEFEKRSFLKSDSTFSKQFEGKLRGAISNLDDEEDFFIMGTCDDMQTLSFDLEISSKTGRLDDGLFVDGRGEMVLAPSIQTSFMYTSVVKRNNKWVTVRMLRVLTADLHLTESVESLISSLDPEILIVNLYHRFHHYGIMNGFNAVEKFATDWLLSALLCCYKSAECEESIYGKFGKTALSAELFSPSERLLDFDGSPLSNEEKLLAQGHPVFRSLPLLIFCLMQSDALRPSRGAFYPSLDARAAASANMSHMPPSSLSRAIAPRIDLWITGETSVFDTPAAENVNMNMDDLQYTVIDEMDLSRNNNSQKYSVPFILIDSPWIVAICNCQYLTKSATLSNDLAVPDCLIQAAKEAQSSYRVAPAFDVTSDVSKVLNDFLIEDSSTTNLLNYKEWKKKVAEIVLQYISE